MNPGGGGCSKLRLHRCTPAWVTEQKLGQERKKERKRERERERERKKRWSELLGKINK